MKIETKNEPQTSATYSEQSPIDAAYLPIDGFSRHSTNLWDLMMGDALEFLRRLDDESVDLITTDPAYESLEKHRKHGTTTRLSRSKGSNNDWFPIFPNGRFPEFFAECYRVLKEGSHLYVMCDQETMFVAKPAGESAGFKFWKPLIWDKCSIGMGYHYRARYECVLFFEKGKRRLASMSVPDVLAFKRIHNGYPTEKPVGLFQVLIEQSSLPGDLIVDPFCGSGSSGVAALECGRRYLGADVSAAGLDVASRRLHATVLLRENDAICNANGGGL